MRLGDVSSVPNSANVKLKLTWGVARMVSLGRRAANTVKVSFINAPNIVTEISHSPPARQLLALQQSML